MIHRYQIMDMKPAVLRRLWGGARSWKNAPNLISIMGVLANMPATASTYTAYIRGRKNIGAMNFRKQSSFSSQEAARLR